jgi:hypothetical protein
VQILKVKDNKAIPLMAFSTKVEPIDLHINLDNLKQALIGPWAYRLFVQMLIYSLT